MHRLIKLWVILLCLAPLNAASMETLTAENLRAMPNVSLKSDDIITLLSGSKVGCWSLFDTTIPSNRRHLINEATEIQASTDFDNSCLFYVTEKSGWPLLVLMKLINTQLGDDLLMLSTPVTQEVSRNPWVAATTIMGALTDEDVDKLTEIFKPFLEEK